MQIDIAEILKLSLAERILLVETIWNSIASEKKGKPYSLSPEQVRFFQEELSNYSKNPNEGSSWDEIKKRLSKKK